ncbi:MAG: translocation/assembly module TamB domain-containing protein [Bacteroidales bacterium]
MYIKLKTVAKKIAKILSKILLGFILFIVLLTGICHTSYFQSFIAKVGSEKLSEFLGYKISMEGLEFSLLQKTASIHYLQVLDKRQQPILTIESAYVELKDYNFKNLSFQRVNLEKPNLIIQVYKGDTMSDFKRILKSFSKKKDTTKTQGAFQINNVKISNGSFCYQQQNIPRKPASQIDFKHIEVHALNVVVKKLYIKNKKIFGQIKRLDLREKSGFDIHRFSVDAAIFPDTMSFQKIRIRTPNTRLKLNLIFAYKNFKSFKNFIEKIHINADISSSNVELSDLAYFVPAMTGMKTSVQIAGKLQGPLSDIKAQNLFVGISKKTHFLADVKLKGLPKIKDGYLDLQMETLEIAASDLRNFKMPNGKLLELPLVLQKIEELQIQGTFKGSMQKFRTDLNIVSNLGDVQVNVDVKDTMQSQKYFWGFVKAQNLQAGELLSVSPLLGKVNLDLQFSALGRNFKEMNYILDGGIHQLQFKGKELSDIRVDCETRLNYFHGLIDCEDPNLSFNFDGLLDYEQSTPITKYKLNLQHADLSRLGLIKDTNSFVVSTTIYSDYIGKTLDNLLGNFNIENMVLKRYGSVFSLNQMNISTNKIDEVNKFTEIKSDFLNLQLEGQYSFIAMPRLFQSILADHLPRMKDSVGGKNKQSLSSLNAQNFTLNLTVERMNQLLNILFPKLRVADELNLDMKYNSDNKEYDMNFSTDYIWYNNIAYVDGKIEIQGNAKTLLLETTAKDLYLGDTIALSDFSVDATFSGKDTVSWGLRWFRQDSASIGSSGDIQGILDFSFKDAISLKIHSANLLFSGQKWKAYPEASVFMKKGFFQMHDFGIFSEKKSESILIDGEISHDPNSLVKLRFNSFDMSYLDFLTKSIGMEIDAYIDGNIWVYDVFNNFNFISDITLNRLQINQKEYGKAILTTSFNKVQAGVYGKFEIQEDELGLQPPTLSISGFYYPQKEQSILFNGKLNQLPVDFLKGFLSSFASNLSGNLTGDISIGGSLKHPVFGGNVQGEKLSLTIALLNTNYIFDRCNIDLSSSAITFKDMVFHDTQYKTKASFKGDILHQNFKNMRLRTQVEFSNFLILNTKPSKDMLYSGTVFATGFVGITGPTDNLTILLKARTSPKSNIEFNLASSSSASQTNFIVFEKSSDTVVENPIFLFKRAKKQKSSGKLTLDLNLDITPDLGVALDIKNSTIAGDLKSKGSGDMRLLVSSGKTQLFGTYTISSGNFDFSMIDVINKQFKIKEGGFISWAGPLLDARVNVEAVYGTRASLYPVLASSGLVQNGESSQLKGKANVESIIQLSGNLLNPDIKFGIDLVNVDEDTKDLFFSVVNKENEEEMLRQTFSLLMMNSFIATGNDGGIGQGLANTALTSSSEMLFNQFNNFLSQLTTGFDIGINYTPGDNLNNSEFQLMMSGQLFNDRLIIEGNLGVSDEKATAKNASAVVGDINVEWKFTDQFRLRAFNHSNEQDLTKPESSYTTGVGVVFRRDFDTMKEFLYGNKPKRTKEEKKQDRQQRREDRQEKRGLKGKA